FPGVPRPRRSRLSRRGIRLPRGARDLEGRVPRHVVRAADGVRPHAGGEELPGPRGPGPQARAPLVGLLWREGKAPRSLRGMARRVLTAEARPSYRWRSTPA